MQAVLLSFHSILRWVILVLLVLSIVKALTGWQAKKAFSLADKKVWLFTLIASHITLLIGLYQTVTLATSLPDGEKIMKNAYYRFFLVEHPVMMIAATVCITLAYGKAKKNIADEQKYKQAFIFFVVALLLILAAIPWPFKEFVGRPLLRGI